MSCPPPTHVHKGRNRRETMTKVRLSERFSKWIWENPNVSTLDRQVRVRISERNTKETNKREQKKFTFYAECEFLRPLGQIYLNISEPTYEIGAEYACMLCLMRRRKTIVIESAFEAQRQAKDMMWHRWNGFDRFAQMGLPLFFNWLTDCYGVGSLGIWW